MQAFTHFSRHAFKRIAQRTKLSCEEIAHILDRKLFFNTGRSLGFNRNHLLFYSAMDDEFLVAIQDGLTGTVVTVLPLEYHKNLAWNISPADCFKAKEIIINAFTDNLIQHKTVQATLFIVSCHYLDDNEEQKTKVLKKIISSPYKNEMNQLLSDEYIFANLDNFATEKGIDYKSIFSISIRLGNKGVPVFIDLQKL